MVVRVARSKAGRRQTWAAIVQDVPLWRDTHVERWLISWRGIPLPSRGEWLTRIGGWCGGDIGFLETQQAVANRDDITCKDLDWTFELLTVHRDTIAALHIGDEIACGLPCDLCVHARNGRIGERDTARRVAANGGNGRAQWPLFDR